MNLRTLQTIPRAIRSALVALLNPASFKRPPQDVACYVLRRLPLEMTLHIMSKLCYLDRLILAQTCSKFREMVQSVSRRCPAASALTHNEYCAYLAIISRDDLNRWACEKCYTLHSFHPKDTFGTGRRYYPGCISGRRPPEDSRKSFFGHFWPEYRHVQLDLKFSRQPSVTSHQQMYFATLMHASYHQSLTSPGRPTLRGTREVLPKIVQGRFLLKVVHYFEDKEWCSPELFLSGRHLIRFSACTHQQMHNGDITAGRNHIR